MVRQRSRRLVATGLTRAAGFEDALLGSPRRSVALGLPGRSAEQALTQLQRPHTIARHLNHSLSQIPDGPFSSTKLNALWQHRAGSRQIPLSVLSE
jgi:hypothetical protein